EDVPGQDDQDQDDHPEKQVLDRGVQRGQLLTGTCAAASSITDYPARLLLRDDLVDVREVGVEALVLHAVAGVELLGFAREQGEVDGDVGLAVQRPGDDGGGALG